MPKTTADNIIQKADLTLQDLITNGGYLSTAQSDRFIEDLIDQPTILNQARIIAMNSPKQEINRIGFGTRILQAAPQDGTALAANLRSAPTTSKITLDTKEVMAEVRLPYKTIEDNISRGSINPNGDRVTGAFSDLILRLIAERAATDLEELAIRGDTASSDPYLALVDGWLKRTTSHVVNHQNAEISKTMFKNGVKTLPSRYHRNLSAMRHFVSVAQNVEYSDKLSSRETSLGDSRFQTLEGNFGSGVPVAGVPLMPETQGLLANPQNLIMGIQREISIEYEKDIRTREFIIVLTTRIDTQIEDEQANVKYMNIAS
ncbi:major capsid protein [Vibrio phage D4]|nr:major capsid protein [Vibrio phage vB_VcaS_HC]UHD87319.1 major capsid protein [Vibrio phage D4]WKV32819.1 major capsid protein [Vibrio phage vB_VhaS_R21Y]